MIAPAAVSTGLLVAGLLLAAPLAAQPPGSAAPPEVPPPGGIVVPVRSYALGLGVGSLRWDDEAPYDDLVLGSLTIERALWSGVRGRAGMGYGTTTLAAAAPIDTRIYAFDLQVLLSPAFGPLADSPILPYGVVGVGSLVVDLTAEPADFEGGTRSQSQVTYGGGVVARIDRWEARVEATAASLRLADSLDIEEGETRTIHNLRWEGRLGWAF